MEFYEESDEQLKSAFVKNLVSELLTRISND